jgi:Tfp pilus assembly protein PilF
MLELADLYQQLGRNDEAIAEYDALLKRDPANDVAANNLAMVLVTTRKDAESLSRASSLVERFAQSPNPAFLDTYGWVLYARGQYAAAVTPLKTASEKLPQAQVLRYHLGMAQLKVGEREAARANLEAAVAKDARYPGVEEARASLASLKKAGS